VIRTGGALKRRRKVTREITIETTETILSGNGSSITASHCHQCGEGSPLVGYAEIVSALRIDLDTLHRWLNDGRVHFQLSEKGGLGICWNTLSVLLEQHSKAPNESPLHSGEALLPPEKRIDRVRPKQAGSCGRRRPH